MPRKFFIDWKAVESARSETPSVEVWRVEALPRARKSITFLTPLRSTIRKEVVNVPDPGTRATGESDWLQTRQAA